MGYQFKVGDVVQVCWRDVPSHWRNVWVREMDKYVGDGIARRVSGVGYGSGDIVLEPIDPYDDIGKWSWPADALALVSDGGKKFTVGGTQVTVQVEDTEDELLEPMTLVQVEQLKQIETVIKKELTPQEKLIQYRRALRDLIGQG